MKISNPKRICIYFFFDKDGIVDEYVFKQLEDMRNNVDYIHLVVNGKIDNAAHKRAKEIVDEVYIRKNKGNDIGAYKAAIKHLGWELIRHYDELIIMNFTCFGPIYPFKEVFDWADEQDMDLWGLSWDEKTAWLGASTEYLHYNRDSKHIQSFFLGFRRPLLGSKFLADFFDEIPENASYVESGSFFEYALPGYFEERGYIGRVYCDDDDLNYPLLHNPTHLLRKYRMPLIKRRSFFQHYTDMQSNNGGVATRELIDFIQHETNYDINLIIDAVLRSCALSDIVRCAQLNRILPKDYIISGHKSVLNVGVILYLWDENRFEYYIEKLSAFSQDAEILIITTSERRKNTIQDLLEEKKLNAEVKAVRTVGRSASALLVGASDFIQKHDLICFSQNILKIENKPDSVTRIWEKKISESLYGSKAYVRNVISLFEREERLGVAFPSAANHNEYGFTIGTGWLGYFDATQDLLKSLGVNVKINAKSLAVFPIYNCLWFRTNAVKKLLEGRTGDGWEYSDFEFSTNRTDRELFHAIERSYAYIAQDAGYYPVFLHNDRFAEIELTNLEFTKIGSNQMRIDMDQMVDESLYGKKPSVETKYVTIEKKYGIRDSANLLSQSLKEKHYYLWKMMSPIRFLGHTFFRLKFDRG